MAEATPTRKSGRGRIPNRKYEDETIETLNEVLSSDSEDDAFWQQSAVRAARRAGDADFNEQTALSVSSDSGSISGHESESSAVATPVEDFEDAQSYADESDLEAEKMNPMVFKTMARPWKAKPPKGNTRSRGLPDNPILGFHRTNRLGPLAGPATEDQLPVLRSIEQWGSDPTLPRRAQLRNPFTHTEENRLLEATKGWDWYYDNEGREAFAKRQKVSHVSAEESVKYLPKSDHIGHDILLGPYGRQKLFHLPGYQCVDVDDAWKQASQTEDDLDHQQSAERQRHGWVLNVGARVRCMSWAPNHNGERQVLALATKRQAPKAFLDKPPAFAPSSPYSSNIQIWSFAALRQSNLHSSTMDGSHQPGIEQVLCTEWGDAKQLKWCPMPRQFRCEEETGNAALGLLAGVFDDGAVRILDLTQKIEQNRHTSYSKIDTAAFTIPPLENTTCTCLCWLSQTDIAIGHSNGFVAAYSLLPGNPPIPQSPTPGSSSPPTPWLIHRLHQTYITSLATAYPSLPTLLTSSSISGHTRLTSLLHPTASTTQSRRTNTPPSTLIYHHALHGCVFPDDGREAVAFTGLRFWGNNIMVADATGAGGVMAVDVGHVHASMAWGCCDGRVVVSNPIGKVVKGSERVWQLMIFRHEWVRRRAPAAAAAAAAAAEEGGDEGANGMGEGLAAGSDGSNGEQGGGAELPAGRRGLSRITEGYKPVQADLDKNPQEKSIIVSGGKGGRGSQTTTIFEEETGVTAVCWNPNLHCGGWLAVGWGNGLVRVEDVAI